MRSKNLTEVFVLRLSEKHRKQLRAIAKRWKTTESHVLRAAIDKFTAAAAGRNS